MATVTTTAGVVSIIFTVKYQIRITALTLQMCALSLIVTMKYMTLVTATARVVSIILTVKHRIEVTALNLQIACIRCLRDQQLQE